MTGTNGNVPAGWVEATLGDLGEYHNGRAFKKEEWAETGRPIIRIQNLTDPSKPYNHFQGEAEPRHEVQAGDLLVSWAATLDVFRWGGPGAVLNQHIFKVESYIDPRYHYYVLKYALDALYAQSHGSGMVHITRGRFDATPVLLPPLGEQRTLASLLDEQLASIADGEASFREALGGLEAYFMAVTHASLTDIEAPRIELGQVASIASGLTKGRRLKEETRAYPFLRAANVRDGSIDISEVKEIEATSAEAERFALEDGDVLMVEGSGSADRLGQGWVWNGAVAPCLHQNHVFRARVDPSLLAPRFLAWTLRAPLTRHYFHGVAKTTTGLASINKRQVAAMPLRLPSVPEQERIVDAVEEACAGIEKARSSLTEQLGCVRDLKRSLLHQALTGQLTTHRSRESAAELLATAKAAKLEVKGARKKRRAVPVRS